MHSTAAPKVSTLVPVAEAPPLAVQLKPAVKKTSPVLCSGRGISQNKNPNIGLNLKSGIEIIPNTRNIEKLSENLRNISNMINNPIPIQSAPQPIPITAKPELPRASSELSLEKASEEHERLVNLVLEEEDSVVAAHRRHVDVMVEMVKREMQLLQELDKPGSDADKYADSLDEMLGSKVREIGELREKLAVFRTHLKQEKELSKKLLEQQSVLEANDSEVNQKEPANALAA